MPTKQGAADALTWMVPSIKHIWTLFKKDLLLEVRMQYSFYGILLYVGATIFVLFLSLERTEMSVWNGLFWIIQLFICINAVAKSFLQESRGRMLYYNVLVHPLHFILSKLLFNTVLMLVMSSISLLLYSMFLGNPVIQLPAFTGIVLLGGSSLSLVFTFLAAIAARAQQNAAIMAILGFPILVPQLILLIRISSAAFSMRGEIDTTAIAMLCVMDVLVILLATILFPFLWKD